MQPEKKEILMQQDCPHNRKIGDNYGMSCQDCGAQLSGYGYPKFWPNGRPPRICIHEWWDEPHMKYKLCTYCEVHAPNEKYKAELDRVGSIRKCPACDEVTDHKLTLFNPDYPEDGRAWQCTKCNETTSLLEN